MFQAAQSKHRTEWGCAAVVLFATLSGAATAGELCGCLDFADLKHRAKEAEVAIQAYQQELQKMAAQMQREHQILLYTPERRKKLQGRVQDALDANAAGKLATAPASSEDGSGGTNNLCQTTIAVAPSTTACMKESLQRHEKHHRDECLKTRTGAAIATTVWTGKDRFERDDRTLMDYAAEEINAYNAEMAFDRSELARLERQCRPKQPERRDYTDLPRNRSPVPSQIQAHAPNAPAAAGDLLDQLRNRIGF